MIFKNMMAEMKKNHFIGFCSQIENKIVQFFDKNRIC